MWWIIALIVLGLIKFDSIQKKIDKMDADPNCSIKSDKWNREHGLLK